MLANMLTLKIRPPTGVASRLGKLEREVTMKIQKQEYTAEFKELAVKQVKARQTIGTVVRELDCIEQTLRY